MHRLAWLVLAALVIASVAFVVATVPQLPERIATHFAGGGQANGWMSRSQYLVFALGFTAALPLAVAAVLTVAPRVTRRSLNLPNRDYWMADPRRQSTLGALGTFGCWLGGLMALLAAGVHYAILQAHLTVPPQLPVALFTGTLVAFFAAIVLWIIALHARFRLH